MTEAVMRTYPVSSGALRSMAMERTPDYGSLVIEDNGIGAGALADRGVDPTIRRGGNAPGGDEAGGRFPHRFRGRGRWL